jgi:CheY-like chemotaxis protein
VTTVLVIEDEPALRGLVGLFLAAAGHTVVEAGDGREGLEAFRREVPDLVLCDLFLPEVDGLAVVQNLGGCTRASGS